MTIQDYESIYKLWISCLGVGLNNLDDSKAGIGKIIHKNPDICFVAVEDDTIVAIMFGNDGRRGYIYHTAVNPAYLQRGIAGELDHHAIH